MTESVLFALVGDPRSSVVRHGRITAHAVASTTGWRARATRVGPSPASDRRVAAADVVHAQFTDHLWGADPAAAAERFVAWADQISRVAKLIITLHDVPRAGEAEPTRGDAYAAVAAHSDGVVVSSGHEAHRLAGWCDAQPAVIPLPVTGLLCEGAGRSSGGGAGERRRFRDCEAADVAVLGFVYPGKGHGEVIDACARLDPAPPVRCLGGAAPGHDDMIDALVRRGHAQGMAVTATGWLDDGELASAIDAVAVPVVAHPDVSASGSLATWIAQGRRPIVARNPYADELASLAPDCVTLCEPEPDALAGAIAAALEEPHSTRHDGLPPALSPPAIAAAHVELYGRLR